MKEKIEKGKKGGRKDRKKEGREGKKKFREIMYFPRFITHCHSPKKMEFGTLLDHYRSSNQGSTEHQPSPLCFHTADSLSGSTTRMENMGNKGET